MNSFIKNWKRNIGLVLVSTSLTVANIGNPAFAGGSISLHVSPQNSEDKQLLRTVFQIYSIIEELDGGSGIKQRGNRNNAGLAQRGRRNQGIILQEGNGHRGSLRQEGDNNAYGLFQLGESTNADVSQYGNGQTGATIVFGW